MKQENKISDKLPVRKSLVLGGLALALGLSSGCIFPPPNYHHHHDHDCYRHHDVPFPSHQTPPFRHY